jgi:hypothetical protein
VSEKLPDGAQVKRQTPKEGLAKFKPDAGRTSGRRIGVYRRESAFIGGESEFAPRTLSAPGFYGPPMNADSRR